MDGARAESAELRDKLEELANVKKEYAHRGMMSIARISEILGISPEELEREAVRSFLLKELRKVRAEAEAIMSRYGVKSMEELDRKIRRGELRETDVLEDLMRLDYLLDREERLKGLLKEMEGG